MSEDAIRALNRRIEELTSENATLKAEAKDRRIKGKKAGDELEKLRKDHDEAVKDRDGWKAKAEAKAPELAAKIEELQGVIREGKHKAAFNAAADAAKVDPKALGDLWTLSGYKAEADEPDRAAIDAAIAGAKESRPYLFRPAEGGAGEAGASKGAEKPRLVVPLDTTRGGGNLQPAAFKVNRDNLQDLGWMTQNAGRMAEARQAGTLVFE